MTGQSERVILIKGDSTKWYNQAIFIVNKNTPAAKMPVDFVAEAEKIINTYMQKSGKPGVAVQGVSSLGAAQYGAAHATQSGKNSLASPRPQPPRSGKRTASTFDITLNIMMILACVAIVAVFVYGLLA